MKKILLFSLFAAASANSFGQEIESGMWGLVEEFNGKPGRGIQIDQQGGNTVVATYFGYRTDGSALFLQASSQLTDGKFSAPLAEYRDGPVLGQPSTSAERLGTVGNIQLTFTSPTTGTVVLPGEGEKAIRRGQYENNSARFSFRFNGSSTGGTDAHAVPTVFIFSLSADDFQLRAITIDPRTECNFSGKYFPSGKGIVSEGSVTCTRESGSSSGYTQNYKTGVLNVTQSGIYSGDIFTRSEDGSFRLMSTHLGLCTPGWVIGAILVRCSMPQVPE